MNQHENVPTQRPEKASGLRSVDRFVKSNALTSFLVNPLAVGSFYLLFLQLAHTQLVKQHLGPTQSLIVVWAFIVLGYHLVFRTAFFRLRGLWIIGLLPFVAFVSLYLNKDVNAGVQVKSLILLLISICLVYPLGRQIAENNNPAKSFAILVFPATFITFLQSLVGMLMTAFAFSMRLGHEEHPVLLGLQEKTYNGDSKVILLFGMNDDTNHAAIFTVLGLVAITIIFLARKQIFTRSSFRIAYTIYFFTYWFLSVLALVLYNSRATYLSLMVCVFLFVPWFFLSKWKDKKGRAITVGISLVVALGMVVVGYGVLRAVEASTIAYLQVVEKDQAVTEKPTTPQSEQTDLQDGEEELTDLNQVGVSKGNALKSARTHIWREGIKLYTHNPIFGIGPYNTIDYAKKYHVGDADLVYLRAGYVLHNSYLDVLVSYGIVGFLVYLIFYTHWLVMFIRRLKAQGCDQFDLLGFAALMFMMMGVFFITDAFLGLDYIFFLILIAQGFLAFRPASKEKRTVQKPADDSDQTKTKSLENKTIQKPEVPR